MKTKLEQELKKQNKLLKKRNDLLEIALCICPGKGREGINSSCVLHYEN